MSYEKINIGVDSLSDAIQAELKLLPEMITEELDKEAKKIAKDASVKLKQVSIKRTGRYADSWSFKQSGRTRDGTTYLIHNVKHYRLTHLLENGFMHKRAKRKIQGRPRIKPVELEAISRFERAAGGIIK